MNPARSAQSPLPVPVPAPQYPRIGPVPVQRPATAGGFTPRRGIWKYCFECKGYYQGQLDGEYRCPACRAAGRTHERMLAPLDGSLAVMPESLSIVPRPSPERVYAELGAQQKATG